MRPPFPDPGAFTPGNRTSASRPVGDIDGGVGGRPKKSSSGCHTSGVAVLEHIEDQAAWHHRCIGKGEDLIGRAVASTEHFVGALASVARTALARTVKQISAASG